MLSFTQTMGMESKLLNEAKNLQGDLVRVRRELHKNAEVGFNVEKTNKIIWAELEKLGIKPTKVGRAGICAVIGNGGEKTLLLRADTDGLPIQEQSGLLYACKSGRMHACGHDMHATALLGAAALLKKNEGKLKGKVKLLFQPAEELLEGAKDCIHSGVLENPKVSAAMMIHVMTAVDLPTGAVVVAEGTSAPAADYFTIEVKGKSCHGSTPWNGVDALLVGAHILVLLQGLISREFSTHTPAVLTVGKMETTGAGNVICDFCALHGTLRSFDEELRKSVKKRMEEIAKNTAKAFHARVKIVYGGGCPTLVNDEKLVALANQTAKNLLGEKKAFLSSELGGEEKKRNGGSEDFAYFSHELPTVMVALCAGQKSKGYPYPLHYPKVLFDESALSIGAALYTAFALKFLNDF